MELLLIKNSNLLNMADRLNQAGCRKLMDLFMNGDIMSHRDFVKQIQHRIKLSRLFKHDFLHSREWKEILRDRDLSHIGQEKGTYH